MFIVNPYIYASGTSYLLDDYPSTFAYSLRALSSSTTNVVRVRRSGDSAESDFTASDITDGTLAAWVTAGGGTEDGFVVTIYNQGSVGSSYDCTQATAANQPKLVSSGSVITLNGKPAMQFDGTNDLLVSVGNAGPSNSYPWTQFGVGNNTLSSDSGLFASVRQGSGDFEGWLAAFNRDTTVAVNIDESASNVLLDYLSLDNTASQRLQTVDIDSSGNGEFFLNNVSQDTATGIAECVPTLTTSLWLGGQSIGSVRLTGHIQEFIWYSTTDEGANISDINTDINTYYSIY